MCVVTSCLLVLFFFFKQKTAYEMRISDWSSDVCSSDLQPALRHPCRYRPPRQRARPVACRPQLIPRSSAMITRRNLIAGSAMLGAAAVARSALAALPEPAYPAGPGTAPRSEEHTSELQSLMRISYAVFCLKKKKQTNTKQYQTLNSQYHTPQTT